MRSYCLRVSEIELDWVLISAVSISEISCFSSERVSIFFASMIISSKHFRILLVRSTSNELLFGVVHSFFE